MHIDALRSKLNQSGSDFLATANPKKTISAVVQKMKNENTINFGTSVAFFILSLYLSDSAPYKFWLRLAMVLNMNK